MKKKQKKTARERGFKMMCQHHHMLAVQSIHQKADLRKCLHYCQPAEESRRRDHTITELGTRVVASAMIL